MILKAKSSRYWANINQMKHQNLFLNFSRTAAQTDFSAWSPKAGITYKLGDKSLSFFTYSHGKTGPAG